MLLKLGSTNRKPGHSASPIGSLVKPPPHECTMQNWSKLYVYIEVYIEVPICHEYVTIESLGHGHIVPVCPGIGQPGLNNAIKYQNVISKYLIKT